jgi:hypothetical protein
MLDFIEHFAFLLCGAAGGSLEFTNRVSAQGLSVQAHASVKTSDVVCSFSRKGRASFVFHVGG